MSTSANTCCRFIKKQQMKAKNNRKNRETIEIWIQANEAPKRKVVIIASRNHYRKRHFKISISCLRWVLITAMTTSYLLFLTLKELKSLLLSFFRMYKWDSNLVASKFIQKLILSQTPYCLNGACWQKKMRKGEQKWIGRRQKATACKYMYKD